MQYLLSAAIATLVAVGAVLMGQQIEQAKPVDPRIIEAVHQYVDAQKDSPIFGTTQPIAGQTYNLAGSGLSQTGTSITLASFTIPQNGYEILDADLSDTFYITLEPGNPTRQEIVSCTTVVQNANNTATLSGCTRGLSPVQPYTALSTLRFSHGGGTQVIFSNPPQFYAEFAKLQNTETVTGKWTFDDNDTYRARIDADTDTAVAEAFVTFGQLSRQAISGASNASETVKGIIELATALEAASSTSAGGTSARLVIPATMATDTPQRGCAAGYTSTAGAGCSVIAQLTGKIRQTWINLTEAYTWTGAHIFNSTATFNGNTTLTNATTTNFGITTVLSTVLKTDSSGTVKAAVRGTDYVPASLAMASTTATSTGSLSCSNCGSKSIQASSTPAFVIPAGFLTASSTIHVTAWGNTDAGAGTGTADSACTAQLRDSSGVALLTLVGSNGQNDDATFMSSGTIVFSSLTTQLGVAIGANEDYGTGSNTTINYNFTSGASLVMVAFGSSSASGGDSNTLTDCTLSGFTIEVNP